MKVCSICKVQKDFALFYKRSVKAGGGRQSFCISCWKEKQNKKYKEDDSLKESIRLNDKKHRALARKFVYEYYKSHPCVDCGETDPVVLELDHVRGEKIAAVSVTVNSGGCSLGSIKKEISKCEVRCSNCHRRKTARDQGWYKDLINDDLKELSVIDN